MGQCGVEGEWFAERYPDGIDLGTAAGKQAARRLYDAGLAVEFGLAVVLEDEERLRFIGETIRLRKELIGATTTEDVAEIAMEQAELRRGVARGILLDLGAEGRRPRELIEALDRTQKAAQALGGPEAVRTMRETSRAWFEAEVDKL